MALVRPSELARAWALHPRTVYLWIRAGRLPAIKTPGAQYRVREADVRAFCEAEGLPLPRALETAASVVLIGKAGPTLRAISRACTSEGVTVRTWHAALDGLVHVARDVPRVVAVDAHAEGVKLADLVRALRRAPSTRALPIVVVDAKAHGKALSKLGASHVFLRTENEAAAATILTLAKTPPERAPARRGRG